MPNKKISNLYAQSIMFWPNAIKQYLYTYHNDNLAYYGSGNSNNWAMQANTTAASLFAVLAVSDMNFNDIKMSRDEVLSWAQHLIRFTLATHHSGKKKTTDLDTWGHSWISALCLERLMHGIDALGELLPSQDIEQLNNVLISESNWLVDNYEITAGLTENNHPESNIWNACLLFRTALMNPSTKRKEEYIEKATSFILNGISTPEDAYSTKLVLNRKISDWHIGANMFNSMACNHHGYMNLGYMVICLSNIAMLHFSCINNNWQVPEGLYHNVKKLWILVKSCTFNDGRLLRIGGDTRVRYSYCQDYAVPAWLLAKDLFNDKDVLNFEKKWLEIVKKERETTSDNSFLGNRLKDLKNVSPLYYLRLEGDRAASLSMGAYWNGLLAKQKNKNDLLHNNKLVKFKNSWSDEYHGSLYIRSSKRLSSWTWRAAGAPQGLLAHPSDSSLVEWQENLSGKILGMGRRNNSICQKTQYDLFTGGFATFGNKKIHSSQYIAEGGISADVATTDIAYVALPDNQSIIIFQKAIAINYPWLREVKGLFFQVGNDIFNNKRYYYSKEQALALGSLPDDREYIKIKGHYLNIDNKISIIKIYGDNLSINRPNQRQIAITPTLYNPYTLDAGGNLYVDEICMTCNTKPKRYCNGEVIFDLATILISDITNEKTRKYLNSTNIKKIKLNTNLDARGVIVQAQDNNIYIIIINYDSTKFIFGKELFPSNKNIDLIAGVKYNKGSYSISSKNIGVIRII